MLKSTTSWFANRLTGFVEHWATGNERWLCTAIESASGLSPPQTEQLSKRKQRKLKNSIQTGEYKSSDPKDYISLISDLKAEATKLGLGPMIGITDASPSSRLSLYKKWIDMSMNGEMRFLGRQDRVERRENLELILPQVRSVIVCSLLYWPGKSAFRGNTRDLKNQEWSKNPMSSLEGIVSSYAWGEDYHSILESKLEALARWLHGKAGGDAKWYVDTGPLMERDLGERAGMGFIGKNTLLIHPEFGSGFFLGEILSTLPLADYATQSEDNSAAIGQSRAPKKGKCGKCTLCQVKCPTGAFASEYVLDARKCISYLTIELKGSIPVEIREKIGARIYGCDICQQVCPWNSFDWQSRQSEDSQTYSPLFGMVPHDLSNPRLDELAVISEEAFQARFRGSAVLRIGRDRLRRNALVALGNISQLAFFALPPLEQSRIVGLLKSIKDDHERESNMIREHAEWAWERLNHHLGS